MLIVTLYSDSKIRGAGDIPVPPYFEFWIRTDVNSLCTFVFKTRRSYI